MQKSAQILLSNRRLNIILNMVKFRDWLCYEIMNTFTRIPRETSILHASYTSNIYISFISYMYHMYIRPVILAKKTGINAKPTKLSEKFNYGAFRNYKNLPLRTRSGTCFYCNKSIIADISTGKKTKGQQNGGKHRLHHFRTFLIFAARFAIGNFVK